MILRIVLAVLFITITWNVLDEHPVLGFFISSLGLIAIMTYERMK